MTGPKSVKAKECSHCFGSGAVCWCHDCKGVPSDFCRHPQRKNAGFFTRADGTSHVKTCDNCNGTGFQPEKGNT